MSDLTIPPIREAAGGSERAVTHTITPVSVNHPLRRTDEELAGALAEAHAEGVSAGSADAAAHVPEMTEDDATFWMRLRFAGRAAFDAEDQAQARDVYLDAYRRTYMATLNATSGAEH
jgi:hypothetical protein